MKIKIMNQMKVKMKVADMLSEQFLNVEGLKSL